jgi:hypothetical protein
MGSGAEDSSTAPRPGRCAAVFGALVAFNPFAFLETNESVKTTTTNDQKAIQVSRDCERF